MKNPLQLALIALFIISPLSAQPVTNNSADKKVIAPQKSKTVPRRDLKRTPQISFVRILNAALITPKIDVYNGPVKVAANLGFKAINNYVAVKSGKNSIKVVVAGKTVTLATDSFTFVKSKHYTVAVYGKRTVALVSINESNGKETPEKARIRVVHLVVGSPTFLTTVFSSRNESGYAKFTAKPLLYGKAASKTIKPKTVKLQFRTEEGKLIKETDDLTFDAGKRYSVFAVGEIGGVGTNALDFLVNTAIK